MSLYESDVIACYGLPEHHCESCHQDMDEWGYNGCFVTLHGEDIEVCCDVARAVHALGLGPRPSSSPGKSL